jgi:hypothetical protein
MEGEVKVSRRRKKDRNWEWRRNEVGEVRR